MLTELKGYLQRNLSDAEIADLPPVHKKTYLNTYRNSLIARGSIHLSGHINHSFHTRMKLSKAPKIVASPINIEPKRATIVGKEPIRRTYYDSFGRTFSSFASPQAVVEHQKTLKKYSLGPYAEESRRLNLEMY